MAFLSERELANMGFRCLGANVKISDKVSIYNPRKITVKNNVRIDDFCILSAGDDGIEIGNYVHIACYCSLIGSASIKLDDFVGISGRTSIYSSNDDYSGHFLSNPNIPEKYKKCLLAFEDKNFYFHPGVDPLAIARAIYLNYKAKKIVSGGSTITMQVVRLSRKGKPRTILEKIIEAFIATKLEIRYSKKMIASW